MAVNTLRQHGKVAWLAPTYKNSRPLWRWAMGVCGGHPSFSPNKSDRTIETRRGGLLAVYSGDNADAVRGESFHLAIVDEAAQLGEEVVNDIVLPTLADYDGELVLIGTPKGKNWFYHEFQKGMADGNQQASWKLPTNHNPMPSIQRAFALAKERVPERTYRQEWLAEFVEDGGEVFRNVRACAVAVPQDGIVYDVREGLGPRPHEYVIGVDWAKTADYNVFAVIDLTLKQCVHVDRTRSIDYAVQRGRLKALWERFNYPAIIAEANAMGEPIIEQLQREGLPVQGFTTTNATKTAIIEALTLAFERMDIGVIEDAVLMSELEAYTSERLPSGLTRYGAPTGMHDDTVMALALAWYGVGEGSFTLEWV